MAEDKRKGQRWEGETEEQFLSREARRLKVKQAFEASQKAYRKACEFDNISPGAMVAVFSDSNPFVEEHRLAWEAYIAVLKS